jgi:DNA-binding transcriptional regulator/RsmH inhibitor MraZ
MLKEGFYYLHEEAMTLSLQDGFVLKRSVFSLVWNYPMDEWNLMMQKINKQSLCEENNDFIRGLQQVLRLLKLILVRLLVPKDLVAFQILLKRLSFHLP